MSPADGSFDYQQFIERKVRFDHACGFDVVRDDIHPLLDRHQPDVVQWMVRGGRRACFASFGLGKTMMDLEVTRLTMEHGGIDRGLIVLPLGVRQEFKIDADKIDLSVRFVRKNSEITGDGIYLTNYESIREGKLDPNKCGVASLDEASVLRSYGSKTYQEFMPLFSSVPFRYVYTATPSPNRYKELIHYAGFLGIMDTGQALTRFFQRDSSKANNLTLYPHKEREFWLWVSTWAIFLQKPSDLGYSDEGYDLPPLDVRYHEVPATYGIEVDRDGQSKMFRDAAVGLMDAAREKRDSMPARVAKLAEIVAADPDDHFLLWHDLEAERHAIKAAVPDAHEVFGSLDLDVREQRVIDFSNGQFKYLATKPELSGSGCNFQRHCHRAIFAGIGYDFNDFIQAIFRIQRFQQPHPVRIDIIYSEAEREVLKVLQQKWEQHNEMVATMTAIIREYGLNPHAAAKALTRSVGIERSEVAGERFVVANNDCVEECRLMEANSVDLIHTSIPFSNHYEYTPSYLDFGHTDGNDHFWHQMDYLTPELLRVLKPGRIAAIHVKDRILFGNVTGAGAPTVSPFHAEAIFHYRRHGFDYMGMITVVTDVVRENNQTYRLGWSEQCKDGTKMGVGSPEYIVLVRKPQTDRTRGYADLPVAKDKAEYTRARWQVDAHAFWRSSGNRLLTPDEMALLGPDVLAKAFTAFTLMKPYNHEEHVQIGEALDRLGALPSTFMSLAPGSHHDDVWHDVNRMRNLNGEQSRKNLQAHVCLARDSLVLTRGGYKPIQQVQVGEQVLTHKGRWRPVVVVQNTGLRPVVNLRAQGVPGLVLTPDHKVWARKNTWARARDGAERAEPKWVPASESVGGYVNLKLPPVETPSIMDPRYWWTVGRWLADGHIDQRGCAVISYGRHEAEMLLPALGDFSGNPPRNTGTAMQIALRDSGHKLRRTLKACGTGAAGKHLPPEAYTLPVEQAQALLEGYLSGDGHYRPERNRWMASSVSKELLFGIAMLAQRVHGAIASVYAGRGARTGVIQGRKVAMAADWILSFDISDRRRRKSRPFVLDDGAWKKVRSAEPSGEVETWNLRIEEDESYTAEGCVVKNCPLQFDIVDRIIRRYTNEGELVFDPFGGLMTVPLRALKLRRRGRAAELNPDYFRDGVRYLQAAEKELDMPDLFGALEDAA